MLTAKISKLIKARCAEPEASNQQELVERMRLDYQVRLAELVLKSEVAAVPVEFTGADEFREQIEELWKKRLPDMLGCIANGRVAFEKDWSYRGGKSVIEDVIPLPYNVTKMKLSRGDFSGIEVDLSSESRNLTIPVESSWWLALDADAKHPQGRSRFQGAPYEVWKERQEAKRLRRLMISKFVIRGLVGYAPDKVELENGQAVDGLVHMAQMADELMAGGCLFMPSDVDPQTKERLYSIEKFPEVSSPKELDDHIDGLDEEQLLAFGVPPKTIMEGDSGTYGMVVALRQVLNAVIDDILKQIESSFQEFVIDKVMEANGVPAGALKIHHEPLTNQANKVFYDLMMALLGNADLSGKILSGVVDIEKILDKMRIPMLPEAKKVLRELVKKVGEVQKQVPTPEPQLSTVGGQIPQQSQKPVGESVQTPAE